VYSLYHVVRFLYKRASAESREKPIQRLLNVANKNGVIYEGGTTVGMLRVMSRRGDDRVTWDEQKVLAGDPEATAAIREAERIFTQERAKGATAFRVEPGKPTQRIEQFDSTAEQIVMVPRVVGG
jgi:hypothetical protein